MTIVACSSAQPTVHSGSEALSSDLSRAILRLSGPRAFELAATVFEGDAESAKLNTGKRWRRLSGHVAWRSHRLPAHAYVMPSPHSYTREDVIELHVPALPWLLGALLEQLLAGGARLAQPGEFTRRAFENGRITLDQAEAIGALIHAQTADEARAYADKIHTSPQTQLTRLRGEIEDLLSLVELGLDFSQEDVGVLSPHEILERLANLRDRAAGLAQTSASRGTAALNSAELNAALPRVVLAGPVNAGKSSLFNALLKKDAAIVNSAAHTTRDAVEAPLTLPGGTCVLNDTAGFDQPSSPTLSNLQRAGCEASREALRRAHIVLIVVDGSQEVDEKMYSIVRETISGWPPIESMKQALVWTHCDLPSNFEESQSGVSELVGQMLGCEREFRVSSKTGQGLPELSEFLSASLIQLGTRHADAVVSAGATGLTAVRAAAAALSRAHAGLAAGDGEDVVAVELREALHGFWQTEGVLIRHDAVTESMLDRIFATFCIGK